MRPIDFAANFESTAQSWADMFDAPFHTHGREYELDMTLMRISFCGIYPETVDAIECDPPAFAARVAAYRHAIAMEA